MQANPTTVLPAELEPAAPQDAGDVEAARRHRASLESFVESGQVEEAARDAEPQTPVEEVEMFDAERIGESHSKGEDASPARPPSQTPGVST